MPTYEYACTKCGHTFETFQSMKDEPLKKCPQCGKVSLKRLLGTGAGLIFKGSGFYITDYKKSSGSTSSESSSKATGEAKSSTSKASDAKPSSGGTKTGKS